MTGKVRLLREAALPRPKSVSDDSVLDAANALLADGGLSSFTLADVARQVGLSRAALIQRFGDRDRLVLRMAEREVAATRAYIGSLPVEPGRDGLWRFLETIVTSMGDGDGFSLRVAIAALEARDPALRALADERYRIVQDAIAARLTGPDAAQTAILLHAVIAGATMQWVANRAGRLDRYTIDRLRPVFDCLVAED
ncbi:TetR/AcrR family transcriptional regulator [Pelagovum pacificum]|uniref:TetR/AcrR family transcriptional regulator n=1 Tax=Pelagovum pacificum TaxID=2588711 RepID=A0A5C5G7U1_9RHOB|nr:TetR/AcrR family transcriptional regulator [Pelagovum pacificum]QQA41810.1 TetR/AcrR family transcriptional regulator [Pelagovum pacificum]TNY30746.1 TetR/AcrR family transcriptional regulator [Pelagovum pacificum]